MTFKLLALIPHYRHADTLPAVVAALRAQGLPVLVVDDGSGREYRAALAALQGGGVEVSFQGVNGGKGAAVKYGMARAAAQGYTHVLQIDADGQHDTALLPHFTAAAEQSPQALICARPVYGADAPKARLYGRQITNFWNIIHTGSRVIKDGMIGLRIYPLADTLDQLARTPAGNRMDFDNEILVRLHWRGLPLVWIDTPVRYAAGGVSHFQGLGDNLRISAMHTRLFFAMLRRRLCRCSGCLKGRL